MDISTREITSKKVRRNNVDYSTIEIISKKFRGNNVVFSTIEITSKKVRGNNLDFLTSKTTSKKVRGNNVDFSTSEITSKSTWNWRSNSSKFSLWRIDVISISNRFDVVYPLGCYLQFLKITKICLNCTKSLLTCNFNLILSAKAMSISPWNGVLLLYFTLLSTTL